MEKLHSLRKHLIERIPGLSRDPDRLLTFVEAGTVEFHRGQHLSHQYRLPVRLVLLDYGENVDLVMLPLLQWLSRYQPDLEPEEAVRFDAEILSNTAVDISLEVTLTERVVAIVDCDEGRINIEHRQPAFEIDPCAPAHWQIYVRDNQAEAVEYDLIAEWGEDE